MNLNAAEEHMLESQGWFIGGSATRTAYIMVAGEPIYLGEFESYIDAETAIDSIRELVKYTVSVLKVCGPAMKRG